MTDRMRSWFMLILPTAASLASSHVAAQEPELLFRVTFDDLTANAQVAKGNAKSTLTRDLGLTVPVKGRNYTLISLEGR